MSETRAIIGCTAVALLFTATASPQSFHMDSFHGRKAYVLENGQIRVSLLRGGGHIAEIRFVRGDAKRTVNPMRVPHYPTIEPYEYDPARHDAIYGDDPHRWLSSGYMGHFLCFPAFGPPSSPAEVKAGLGNHGEAPIVEWKPVEQPTSGGKTLRFRYGADLPKTQYRVDRTVTMAAGEPVMLVEEWVESLASFDRPVNWMQHATLGPPFIAPGKNRLELSGTQAKTAGGDPATSSLKPDSEFRWPYGLSPEGTHVDLRLFQPKPHSGTYAAILMDRSRPVSYFTMDNPDFPVLIGYLFRTAESPWVGDFQENQRIKTKPWNGVAVTRGIEFGTTPYAEGVRRSVDRGTLFGVPTYRWIGGRERQKMTYAIFLAEVPSGFAGVADVVLEGDTIVIRERDSSRRIALPASAAAAALR